jgi:uncharacterized membrane-anchored protein YjiN (DUF445 family)
MAQPQLDPASEPLQEAPPPAPVAPAVVRYLPNDAALSVPQPLRPEDEAERQRRLSRMKAWAAALLVLASIVFVIARLLEARFPWLGIVRATAEASMVGGLADWFAVTALFRHPLGIPIPHTAIIPAKKDRVGATLGAFVQKNFLNPDVIAAKLQTLRPAERMAHWMIEPENARVLARHIGRSLAAAAEVLRDDDVQDLLHRTISARVRQTQVAPLLGKLLSVMTLGNRHQALMDEAIRLSARAVAENEELIKERVESESPWWIPGVLDERIAKKIIGGLERTLEQMHEDPNHPLRARFDGALHDFVQKLQTSPDVIARAEEIKEEVLNADVVRSFTASLWADAKAKIATYAEDPEGVNPDAIQRGLTAFGGAILADPALMAKLDAWVTEAALSIVERYQNEVGELIASTVRRWDPDATSRRIELAIGRDLQFIRINGTIVGGLAGMGLYLVQRMF